MTAPVIASIIATKSTELNRTKAPQLPAAPVVYDRAYQDALTNIMRQYFNTLDNFVGQFTSFGVYTVDKLPAAADAGIGARAFVLDSSVSTFGSTVTGAGSTNVPVYSDGTVWKVG
jgi:hypothetical protein